ncbi:hypothetical protein [Nocardia terpenica]|uniref:hypothetical protein n=1 Tax=Nocardia terpenica TaxID=455432 RepID=UPI002FE14180
MYDNDGVEVEYVPAHGTDYGSWVAAYITVELGKDHAATMGLSIEDARTLLERLTRILMLHDSVAHLAAEKAVA